MSITGPGCPRNPARGPRGGLHLLIALVVVAGEGITSAPARDAQEVVVRGRIVDSVTRSPIAGAQVIGPVPSRSSSDDRGEFEIALAGPAPVTIEVRAEGYLSTTIEVLDPSTGRPVEVTLDRAPSFVERVVVTGLPVPKPEPAQKVDARTVAQTPGAIEDALQSLRSLPGVLSRDDWTGRLYIRGGRPDQNGVYLDGIPVYDPYRLFGLNSLFNPETLESTTLFPGGFDARYGDHLSAVIAGENRVGTTDRAITGSAGVSLTNANLRAEGRLGLPFRSSWLASYRRSYFDLVSTEQSMPLFTDFQSRFLLEPSPRNRFTVTLYGAEERTDATVNDRDFEDVPESRTDVGDDQRNLAAGLQARHLLSDHLGLYYVACRTNDQQASEVFFRDGETGFETRFDQDLTAAVTALRTWIESPLGRHTLEAGGEVARSDNRVGFHITTEDPRMQIPDSLKSFSSRESFTKDGAYVQDTWSISGRLDLKAGARWDRSGLSAMSATSPRASLFWRPGGTWEVRAAWGHYYQYPSYESLQGDGYFLDLRGIEDAGLRPEHAVHYVLGTAFTGSAGWKISADIYDKRLDDLLASGEERETILVLDGTGTAQPYTRDTPTYLPENARRGDSRGADVVLTLLEGRGRPCYGMLAYTFGRTRTREDSLWQWEAQDQRHSVSMIGGCKIRRAYGIGWRWQYAAGFPYTPVTNVIRVVDDRNGDGDYDPAIDTFTYQRDDPDSVVNSSRLPAYHRLDLRFDYSRRVHAVDWTFYLDIINAYARENVEDYTYNADFSERGEVLGLPIIPSFGVRANF